MKNEIQREIRFLEEIGFLSAHVLFATEGNGPNLLPITNYQLLIKRRQRVVCRACATHQSTFVVCLLPATR